MVNIKYKLILLFLTFFTSFEASAKRLQIRSVGSTTVYPFSVKVSEAFAKKYKTLEPLVTSTGTGQGIDQFCSTSQNEFSPDFTGASRKIKDNEIQMCKNNKVGPIIELPIGYDGIILALKKGTKFTNISLEELFLATSKIIPNKHGKLIKNPYKKWRDINPRLPNIKIQILLPQVQNGTYGSFMELAMDEGCKGNSYMKKLLDTSGKSYKELCQTYRNDGDYVTIATKYDLGDSHDLFIQKIYDNPGMLGVMGYSFLKQFKEKIDAISVGNVSAHFDKISSLEYPLSRLLYIYVRKDRLNKVEGLKDFIDFYQSDEMSGDKGLLVNLGLIPFNFETRPPIQTIS